MRSDNTFLKLILVLSLLGILVSGWLLSTHIKFASGQAGLTEGCTILGVGSPEGCANIAVSGYSYILGVVPVAAVALAFYFTLVLLVFWAMRNYQIAYEALYVSYFLSTLSIVATVVMFYISRFVVQSFCIGCAVLWLVNLAIWPCFVMHLRLSWANALAGNLELVRHKALQLRRERIVASFIVGAVCLVVFSVVGAAAKGKQNNESRSGEPSLVSDYQNAPQTFLPTEAIGGFASKGATAPVMDIIEFADFQCPGCRMASQFLKPFEMKYGAKVRVTYRNFPLDGSCNALVPNGGHTMACAAARASICAGRQQKFWPMHDEIFDNQDGLSHAVLDEIVGKIGLDKTAFESCLKDPATNAYLQKDIQWGEMIQLESTPTMIINGRRLVGARTPQDLEALLQVLEKGAK